MGFPLIRDLLFSSYRKLQQVSLLRQFAVEQGAVILAHGYKVRRWLCMVSAPESASRNEAISRITCTPTSIFIHWKNMNPTYT